jgi:putative endonuclease
VQRRFRSGHRDIDLVVEQGGVVAFVEVKARRGLRFGDPVEAASMDLAHSAAERRMTPA